MTDMGSSPHSEEPEAGVIDDIRGYADQNDDTSSDAIEPVELLVQLAEEGRIDPWEVDIVDATDAFLNRLDKTDLRTSGRALFYAAVLLRMKSEALIEPDEPADASESEPWEVALEAGTRPIDEFENANMTDGSNSTPHSDSDPIDALEDEMDRRLERKKPVDRQKHLMNLFENSVRLNESHGGSDIGSMTLQTLHQDTSVEHKHLIIIQQMTFAMQRNLQLLMSLILLMVKILKRRSKQCMQH
jgi:condensin subunit ScpA